MIVNGNYYQNNAGSAYSTKETNQMDALVSHMNKSASKSQITESDSVNLSQEAYAALKQFAPEALTALGINEKNPVLEVEQEIAKEKFFHFGTEYLKLPDNQDDMISALDVANRYMDALNSIEPDDIYEAVASSNNDGASYNNLESLRQLIA